MKDHIYSLLSEALPAVDFDTDFLFSELDSLGIATILLILSKEFEVSLDATDVTPRNFKTIDSIVAMVEKKMSE